MAGEPFRQKQLPDWRKWLADSTPYAALDAADYELHLAAIEWGLSSALDINRKEDFISLPSPTVEPFAHQVEDAILFFRRLAPRGLIADDVGLGKTVTAGLIARELLDRGRIESLLVVCPKSLIDQWKEELESKFGMNARIGIGATEFRDLGKNPFWITSYHTARSRMNAIRERGFDLAILDEGHALRNLYGGQTAPQVAKAFSELMRKDAVRYCLMLTATPIQNRLWDMYSLVDILKAPQPNPLGTPDEFRRRFIADQAARQLRLGTQEAFRRAVGQVAVRTRRADTHLLFPAREVRDQRLTPLAGEREFIDEALQVILQFPPLVQVTHARTLMSSPWAAAAAFDKAARQPNLSQALRQRLQGLARLGTEIRQSAKVRAVVELAKASATEGRAGRLIVFTQRVETIRHLAEALEGAGFAGQIATMQGGQATANLRAIHDFVSDPATRPILLSTDTGAVGLNLQAGNIVINYDLPWNPMVLEQRIGRVQRLGQTARNVIVYNLVLAGTIEDHIILRLMEKLSLFTQAIGEMEELLELCGYDDEGRSLDQVIMDLIRRAAEQKDIAEDLRLMEDSRTLAEEKIKEMREATENALASIRPKDTGDRLEGLERADPRLPLYAVVRSCLKRAGADYRESDGRLFARVPEGYAEFVLDRHARTARGDQEIRPIFPGTKAFDHVTRDARERIAHHINDGTQVGLDLVEKTLAGLLAPLGVVLERLTVLNNRLVHVARAAVKVTTELPSDRYEMLLDVDTPRSEDGLEVLPEAGDDWRAPSGETLPQVPTSEVGSLGETVQALDARILAMAEDHPSVMKFCSFYEERFKEDLDRLAEHALTLGFRWRDGATEDFVNQVATRDPSVRAALASLRFRFTPTIRFEPVGVAGLRYYHADLEAVVRNRNQREGAALRISAVPFTGVLHSSVPGIDTVPGGAEAWACPKGHLAAASDFAACFEPKCTVGLCSSCLAKAGAAGAVLLRCSECGRGACEHHRAQCLGCERPFCEEHVTAVAGRGGRACAGCSVRVEGGRMALAADLKISAVSGRRGLPDEMVESPIGGGWAFPEELEDCEESHRRVLPKEIVECAVTRKRVACDLVDESAVSGRRALRELMPRSALSGRPCLPGEESICDETGAVLLPDEVDRCSATGRRARKDLLGQDVETGLPVLKRLLHRSEVSGQAAALESMARSARSGREGLASEVAPCAVCHARVLTDELMECRETGLRACLEHFVRCEGTGESVLPEGLGQCEVSGKRVRKRLLKTCPETGKTAWSELFGRCEVTGAAVLPEGLAACSVSGKVARRSLLVACEQSGQLALPTALATCGVTGKRVRPDLLVECPETGLRFLAASGQHCDETGTLIAPLGLGRCEHSGRVARRSLLARDDVSGKTILSRLLETCSITGQRTLSERLLRSSVSGRPALAESAVFCAATGRPALPGELATCAVTGRAVLPELLVSCAETGARVLRDVALQCEASGELVSPGATAICEATGKRVRRSLLGVDEVTGERVLNSLLRTCEKTGRRALPAHFVRSVVSGTAFLGELAARCEESGAVAMPEELGRCEVTGKRVLPNLLGRCEVSQKVALRSGLRTCQITGKEVLPEFLERCRRSGKAMLSHLMAASEVSGERGLQDLLVRCEATGRRAFPDELLTSGVTGRRIGRDRSVVCPLCERVADIAETGRCECCEQVICRDDRRGGICRSCVKVLTRTGGRAATEQEVAQLTPERPWARRAWLAGSPLLLHLYLEPGSFSFRGTPHLVVAKGSTVAGLGEALKRVVEDRVIPRALMERAEVLARESSHGFGAGGPPGARQSARSTA